MRIDDCGSADEETAGRAGRGVPDAHRADPDAAGVRSRPSAALPRQRRAESGRAARAAARRRTPRSSRSRSSSRASWPCRGATQRFLPVEELIRQHASYFFPGLDVREVVAVPRDPQRRRAAARGRSGGPARVRGDRAAAARPEGSGLDGGGGQPARGSAGAADARAGSGARGHLLHARAAEAERPAGRSTTAVDKPSLQGRAVQSAHAVRAGHERRHLLDHPRRRRAAAPAVRLVQRRGGAGAERRRRSRRHRHQADALSHRAGLGGRGGAGAGGREREAGHGHRGGAGALRRGAQHRLGAAAGGSRACRWSTAWWASRRTRRCCW